MLLRRISVKKHVTFKFTLSIVLRCPRNLKFYLLLSLYHLYFSSFDRYCTIVCVVQFCLKDKKHRKFLIRQLISKKGKKREKEQKILDDSVFDITQLCKRVEIKNKKLKAFDGESKEEIGKFHDRTTNDNRLCSSLPDRSSHRLYDEQINRYLITRCSRLINRDGIHRA